MLHPSRQGAHIKIFLIAGEPSGDVLGEKLIAAIKRASPTPVRFIGIGGERMVAEGLETLFPLSELSVMGIAEIVPHLSRLLRRISETADAIEDAQPDLIVTIDAPAFCVRVLKRLKNRSITRVHYVAPSVWAWRPGRARKMAGLVDHLLALLPFEPPYFEAVGLPTTFVGHPVLEQATDNFDGAGFREKHQIVADAPLLCLLPGSRRGELKYLLPAFKDAVSRLKERMPELSVVLPTIPNLADNLRAELNEWSIPVVLVTGDEDKYRAMAAANVALAASGTVALELALFSVPSIFGYRVHPITAAIVRRLVKVKYANLVNLLIDRPAVPEFIQDSCRGDLLADAVGELLTDSEAADRQRSAMGEAMALMSTGAETPSGRAANVLIKLIGEEKIETQPLN
jgi:lipid-A-disaccharide synthase